MKSFYRSSLRRMRATKSRQMISLPAATFAGAHALNCCASYLRSREIRSSLRCVRWRRDRVAPGRAALGGRWSPIRAQPVPAAKPGARSIRGKWEATWTPESAGRDTIYFPVTVPDALLFLGDGHAARAPPKRPATASRCRSRPGCKSTSSRRSRSTGRASNQTRS